MFVAPSTSPTTLYLLEKKVTQSSSVPFSFSFRSCQLGLTSSAFVDVFPSALDASFPANTAATRQSHAAVAGGIGLAYRGMSLRAGRPCFPSRHTPCPIVIRNAWLAMGLG